MLHESKPSGAHVPRIEPNGPITKIFLLDQWNPFHVVEAVDTGPPHDHPFSLDADILLHGYIESVWVLTPGGGFTLHLNVFRRPRTTHRIDAETIHLITGLPGGFSITYARPEEAKRPWFHYLPNHDDGSVRRSPNWNGPWEDYHPAGPVHVIDHDILNGGLEAQGIARLAPVAAGTMAPDQSFIIGPNNTWEQAVIAMENGHQVWQPTFRHDTTWIIERISGQLFSVLGSTKQEWAETALPVLFHNPEELPDNWIVLPIIHPEPPTV